jgi:alpha-ketoglutarate-dependent 2,4-dichlorophenoxyacetate dioxygenase
MSIEITPLHPVLAGEVAGIDTTQKLTPEAVAAIASGMDRYAVLVFRDQRLTDETQLAFTLNFGDLEHTRGNAITKPEELRLDPAFADVSNLDKNHRPLPRDSRRRLYALGNRLWHSDSSFRAVPATYSLLSGRIVVDKGGETEFADLRAAYDALDAATKAEVEDLLCEHSLMYSRGQLGFSEFADDEREAMRPVRQRLVRTHPVTGRKSLFLAAHIGTIVGWPMPEARAFIRDLIEHATQPQFVYAHKWRQWDLVMWDNRQVMHRVRRFDDTKVRDMRRTTVGGTVMTAEQEARAAE